VTAAAVLIAGGGVVAAVFFADASDGADDVRAPWAAEETRPSPATSSPIPEPPVTTTAPLPRLQCNDVTPDSPVVLPYDGAFVPLAIMSGGAIPMYGIEGAAFAQAGYISCPWSDATTPFRGNVSALPDAAEAFRAAAPGLTSALNPGALVDTVADGSVIDCINDCYVNMVVDGTWVELYLFFGPLGHPAGVEPTAIRPSLAEAVARAVADQLGGTDTGTSWIPDARAYNVASLCGTAADVLGAAPSTYPREDMGPSARAALQVAERYTACGGGEVAYVSGVTGGGWAFDDDPSLAVGGDVSVASANGARVACDYACSGYVVYRGSLVNVWTVDADPEAWTQSVTALLAALESER
jgi:hypothetical protein